MSAFLERAEDILDTAFEGDADQDVLILMDRQGGMRILDSSGWTLPAVSAEYGASAVYHVERRSGTVRVEGLSGSERCLLQRKSRQGVYGFGMPGMPAHAHRPQAMMLHTAALALG